MQVPPRLRAGRPAALGRLRGVRREGGSVAPVLPLHDCPRALVVLALAGACELVPGLGLGLGVGVGVGVGIGVRVGVRVRVRARARLRVRLRLTLRLRLMLRLRLRLRLRVEGRGRGRGGGRGRGTLPLRVALCAGRVECGRVAVTSDGVLLIREG